METEAVEETQEPASIEDRLAGALGFGEEEVEEQQASEEPEAVSDDTETTEETPEVKEDEPEFIEMELDGVVYEIPKALEKGFTQEKAYTQKSQGLAEDRKEFEFQQKQMEATKAEYSFAASIQEELTQIAQIDAYITQASNLNWQDMTTDEMVRAKHELDMVEKQKTTLVEGLTVKQKEYQEQQEQARKELLDKGSEVLKSKIPGWNETEQKEMHEYALSDGYTEQEISSITDPRFVNTLWKAKQYDKLKSGAEGAKVKLKEAPTIKAKARENTMDDAAKNRLKLNKIRQQTGVRASKKAEQIMDNIADRF